MFSLSQEGPVKQWMMTMGFAILAGAVTAVPAQAQGFVGGLGGMTFGTATDVAFGGRAGVRLAPHVYLLGEVGRMRDVMPADLHTAIEDALASIPDEIGPVPIDVDVRLKSTYGLGAIRAVGAGPVAPFVEVGGGVARLSLDISASIAGFDVGDEVEDLAGSDALDTTEPLIMAGGGLRLATGGGSSVDLGYRYTRILVDNPKINTSLVYLGINFGR
jgi:hypothetical protein